MWHSQSHISQSTTSQIHIMAYEVTADPDEGPLTLSPVLLAVDKMEFVCNDTAAGSIEIGQYTVVTKD